MSVHVSEYQSSSRTFLLRLDRPGIARLVRAPDDGHALRKVRTHPTGFRPMAPGSRPSTPPTRRDALMLRGASPKFVAAAAAATVICTGAVVTATASAAQAAPVAAAAAPHAVKNSLSTTVAPGGNFNLSVW